MNAPARELAPSQVERSTWVLSRGGAPELHVTSHTPSAVLAPWTLLLVHGTAGHGGCYDAFARAAAERGIEVHALDLRGHGRSGGRRGVFTFEGLLEDTDAVARELAQRGRPVVLLGASQGGEVAFHALAASEAVAGAACMNVLLSAELPMNAKISLMQGRLLGALVRLGGDRLKVPLRRVIDFEAAYQEDPELMRRKGNDPLYVWRYGLASYRSVFTYRPPRPAAANQKPVFVLVGDADPLVGAAHCRACYERMGGPKSLHVMPNAGHQLMEFHPTRTLDALCGWVEHAVLRGRAEPYAVPPEPEQAQYQRFLEDQRQSHATEEAGYRLSPLDRTLAAVSNGDLATGVEFFRHVKRTPRGAFISSVVKTIDAHAWPVLAPHLPERSTEGPRAPTMAVLGCGTGDGIHALLEADPRLRGWHLTGIDVDAEALALARARSYPGKTSFLQADARELGGFAAEAFDAIYCHGILDHCSNHQAVFDACRAALRPGGVLLVVTPDRNWSTWLRFIAVGPRFVFGLGRWSNLHDFRRFSRPAELDGLARNAGLEPVPDPEAKDGRPWRRGLDYSSSPLTLFRAARGKVAQRLKLEVTPARWWFGGGFRGEYLSAFRRAG